MNLPDSLLEAARFRAQQEGRTVTSLVEEALRALLEDEVRARTPMTLPTWTGGRLLVDLDDKAAVWNVLDAEGLR